MIEQLLMIGGILRGRGEMSIGTTSTRRSGILNGMLCIVGRRRRGRGGAELRMEIYNKIQDLEIRIYEEQDQHLFTTSDLQH